MDAEPVVRAAVARAFFETVKSTEPSLLTQLAAVGTVDIFEAIDETAHEGWVPLRRHSQLNDAALQIIGVRAFRAVWRGAMLRLCEESTLKPLFDGAIRLFGRTPDGLIKIGPRAWSQLLRAAGEIVLDPAQASGLACVRLVGLPADVFAGGSFVEALAGCFEAFSDLCDVKGEVAITRRIPAEGSAVYVLSWC